MKRSVYYEWLRRCQNLTRYLWNEYSSLSKETKWLYVVPKNWSTDIQAVKQVVLFSKVTRYSVHKLPCCYPLLYQQDCIPKKFSGKTRDVRPFSHVCHFLYTPEAHRLGIFLLCYLAVFLHSNAEIYITVRAKDQNPRRKNFQKVATSQTESDRNRNCRHRNI